MQNAEDFAGMWLVTRADSVHVAKGSYIHIKPKGPAKAAFSLYAPWQKEVRFEGVAAYQDGLLRFTVLGALPPAERQRWQFCAAVMTAEGGKRFLFGLAIQGDPHAAGVFGAEEDGSGW